MSLFHGLHCSYITPDSKVHGANMGPTLGRHLAPRKPCYQGLDYEHAIRAMSCWLKLT